MLLKHFFTEKIAHSSYLLAGEKTCAVIDPQRDIDVYVQQADSLGVRITHIIQTHLHADFVSGHMDLAAETGASIYVAASANCAFDHVAMAEGDVIPLEDMQLQVLETPGHTPEHVSIVVVDSSRSDDPVGVFVGDTLFVGDVGRPDLFPSRSQELAAMLYHSLHEKLMKLPDYCEVYPAHGAGSLCGRSMGAKQLSTIGYERRFNQALQIKDEQSFIASLTEDMPPAPDHFGRCSDINRQGPVQVVDLPRVAPLSAAEFAQSLQRGQVTLVDVRSYLAFGGQHIPGALSLDLAGNFPTFAGWVLPPDQEILLVAENRNQVSEALRWSRRVGVDQVVGFLESAMVGWVAAGLETETIPQLSPARLQDWLLSDRKFVLLDVRAPQEWEAHHIEGAVNIPAADLRTRYTELDRTLPVITVCSSGNRSSMAASILQKNGFSQVMNLAGGMAGYTAAGYSGECLACALYHGPRATTTTSS